MVVISVMPAAGLMISLGKSLSLALEFKMGAEIINTVIVRDLKELGILAIVIIIRALLAILIHWEIKMGIEDDENEKRVKKSISDFVASFLLPFNFAVNNARANSAWAESDQELMETMKGDLSSFVEEWMYQVCRKNRPGSQDKEAVLSTLFNEENKEK